MKLKRIMTLAASGAIAVASLAFAPLSSEAQFEDYYESDLYESYGWSDDYEWGFGEDEQTYGDYGYYGDYEYQDEWWSDDYEYEEEEQEEDDFLF